MANVALPDLFNEINEGLGYALKPMDSKDNVVGRDKELTDLSIIMRRRETQVALLLAPAGTGKTALVGSWKNKKEASDDYIEIFQLEIGLLGGGEQLKRRMTTLLPQMKKYKDKLRETIPNADVVIFIDEVHKVITTFGESTKIGGDLLKESLARAEEFVKVITATTPEEYNSYIAQDKPLARRFKTVRLQEVTPKVTLQILKNWLNRHSEPNEDLPSRVSDSILRSIIIANRTYRESFYEPAKSIDVLTSLVARSDETGRPIDYSLLAEVFRTEYTVDLSFDVDPKAVLDNVKRRVLGQPLAIEMVQSAIEEIAFGLYEGAKRPRATMLFPGTTGVGKSINDNELVPIYTKDGKLDYKRHGDLKVGDYVYNRLGKPVKVTGVYPQGLQREYRVTFRNGASVVCNDEHLWTYKHGNGNGGKHWKTTELKNLIDKGISRVDKTGRTVHKFKVPTNEAIESKPIEYQTHPYLVGAFVGNGSLMNDALILSSNDKFIDNKIGEILDSPELFYDKHSYDVVFRLPEYKRQGLHRSRINYHAKDVFGHLPEIYQKKSHEKSIPSIYKQGSIEQRWDLIQGLFDTDGSIDKNGTRYKVRYDTTSSQLAEDIKEVLASLGFMSTIASYQRNSREGIQNREYVVRVKAQNKDKHLFFSTPKKKDVALEAKNFVKKREKKFDAIGIESVEDLGTESEMQCIMVDDPEHLYCVTKDFIVTHNTELAKALCEGITGDEKNLIIISMTDYSDENSEVRFRQILGESVANNMSGVVLLDELEKASQSVRNVLLPVLDEGIVTYHRLGADGRMVEQTVSLKNTIIIATSNAGHETLNTMSQYNEDKFTGEEATDEMIKNSREVSRNVVDALSAYGMTPEFIARFDNIVPFLRLHNETLIRIARKQLEDMLKMVYTKKNIRVTLPPDKDWSKSGTKIVSDAISMYIVIERMDDDTDAGKNGAREIRKIIKGEILSRIIRAYYENPGVREFELDTNKMTRFEITDSGSKEGLIRVYPKKEAV